MVSQKCAFQVFQFVYLNLVAFIKLVNIEKITLKSDMLIK